MEGEMTAWLLRLHTHDERILHALIVRRRRLPDLLMNAVTHFGDAATTVALTLLLLLGITPDMRSSGAYAAVALVSSHLGVQLLKRTINRARPKLPVGYDSLIHAPDRFSFPSGHAAASMSVAVGLAFFLPAAGGAAVILLAIMVGVSRCYLGVHYPGDVLVGWALSLVGILLATMIF
jgi:undecaprenyl-diphosphatase